MAEIQPMTTTTSTSRFPALKSQEGGTLLMNQKFGGSVVGDRRLVKLSSAPSQGYHPTAAHIMLKPSSRGTIDPWCLYSDCWDCTDVTVLAADCRRDPSQTADYPLANINHKLTDKLTTNYRTNYLVRGHWSLDQPLRI